MEPFGATWTRIGSGAYFRSINISDNNNNNHNNNVITQYKQPSDDSEKDEPAPGTVGALFSGDCVIVFRYFC